MNYRIGHRIFLLSPAYAGVRPRWTSADDFGSAITYVAYGNQNCFASREGLGLF